MMRRVASILVLALVAAVCVVGQRAPVEAAAGACRDLPGASLAGGELEGSTPVVLVHGFTGSSMSWYGLIDQAIDDDIEISDPGSFVEKVLQIDGVSVWMFDYHDTSARWVTDPSIGAALADLLECLADNGGQPAVLAVHSMGGLAARYAMGLLDDASVVSGLVTFGTPHLGSDVAAWMSGALDVADVASMGANPLLGSVWSFVRRDLDACAAAKNRSVDDAECGWVGGAPPLGSEAGEALQRGSSAVMSLPSVPEHVEVLGIAGQIDIVLQESVWGFFYSDIGRVSIGDTMVMVDSAIAESDETVVRTCQLNLKTGYAISDDFRELAEINYDDGKERGISALMSNPCQHSNLMHTVEFTSQALGYINSIVEAQRPMTADVIADLIGCAGDCQVTGTISFDHPTWGPSTLATYFSEYPGEAVGIVAFDASRDVVWRSVLDGQYLIELVPQGQSPYSGDDPSRFAADSLGHLFLGYSLGRYAAVIVLVPTRDGFDDLGSLPNGDSDSQRFPFAEVVDVDGDGRFELREGDHSCLPSCAEGPLLYQLLVWDGADYVTEMDVAAAPIHFDAYTDFYEFYGDGQVLWSGCVPTGGDGLPDGKWMGYVGRLDVSGLDFDLACDFGWRRSDTGPRTLVVNEDPGVRRLPWSDDAYVYGFDEDLYVLTGPESVDALVSGSLYLDPPNEYGSPAVIYVNDGVVTGLLAIHRP